MAACNGQKLPLALGQVGTVTVKHCVIPLRKAADEGVGVGNLGRSHHIPIRCIQAPVPYIVGNGTGEKMGILYDHGQGTAQVILFNVPDINAVIGDAAAVYFIKTVNRLMMVVLPAPVEPTKRFSVLVWHRADAVGMVFSGV